MPIYDLIEYSNNYSKTSGSLNQFCRDESNNVITEPESLKFQSKLLRNNNNEGIVNAKTAVPFKYLSTFWRIFEIPLIKFEINLILT